MRRPTGESPDRARHTRGQRANDYNYCLPGELVRLASLCDCDHGDPDGPCGCARSFAGFRSPARTTTAIVTEMAIARDESWPAPTGGRAPLIRAGTRSSSPRPTICSPWPRTDHTARSSRSEAIWARSAASCPAVPADVVDIPRTGRSLRSRHRDRPSADPVRGARSVRPSTPLALRSGSAVASPDPNQR
ncbi:DUF7715 family protein [Nonomuraea wenchangensis]|uniref:DUF7715 family protein n=1 Tax=Nonomuraea wenchangensis TaxID=568860 RepID=UPI003F4D907D